VPGIAGAKSGRCKGFVYLGKFGMMFETATSGYLYSEFLGRTPGSNQESSSLMNLFNTIISLSPIQY
jgi:hypothetical protein